MEDKSTSQVQGKAEFTVIRQCKLHPSDKKLFGAGGILLPVQGLTKVQLRVDHKTIDEKIHIVDNQCTNLLSKLHVLLLVSYNVIPNKCAQC